MSILLAAADAFTPVLSILSLVVAGVGAAFGIPTYLKYRADTSAESRRVDLEGLRAVIGVLREEIDRVSAENARQREEIAELQREMRAAQRQLDDCLGRLHG